MKIVLSAVLSGVLLFAGCSSVNIHTDYDGALDFSQYQTYRWMPHPDKRKNTVQKGSFLDVRIKRAVTRELEQKGFVVKQSGPVDALLAYHVTVKEQVSVSHFGVGYGWWYGRSHVNRYKVGTLVIDVVDPELKQLAWRGTASGAVSSVNESEQSINNSIAKIFKRYPPGSKL